MTIQTIGERPQTANLEDPLYYLKNMDTVVSWVTVHHGDLLTSPERARLAHFAALPTAARGLLTRMIMRSGELFRTDKLNYPELPQPLSLALGELMGDGWLDSAPLLDLDQLFRLMTLAELRPGFAPVLAAAGAPAKLAKNRMREVVGERPAQPRTAQDWLGEGAPEIVRLLDMPLFDRVRLMFFGNLRQSWTDFVLVELGHQQYEQVTFSTDSRAFHERADVDTYLQMDLCRQWLDQGIAASEIWPEVPAPHDNPWLTSRRDRLLLELGRQAEREGDRELALAALSASGHREARLKQLRLLERMKRHREAWEIAVAWQSAQLSDAEAQGLTRIFKRLAARLGETPPRMASPITIEAVTVTLDRPATGSVEHAVQQHLWQDDAPVYYVENTLITALFGLLCWQTIYAPVPGAFFHPFHVGPADLNREDFVERRTESFEKCFASLGDGSYRERIRENYRNKQGITNPFVIWPAVSGEVLELALACIPAADLERLFRRLLWNIREHRSGFPDLIRFHPGRVVSDRHYEMIEVKGPGDRLQDHQVRWLEFFAAEGIPASVCYVRWRDDGGSQ